MFWIDVADNAALREVGKRRRVVPPGRYGAGNNPYRCGDAEDAAYKETEGHNVFGFHTAK